MQLSYKIFPHTVRRVPEVARSTIDYPDGAIGPQVYPGTPQS